MRKTLRPDSDKIRSLRTQKGWAQEQLARIADVSPLTIQRVEAGGNASFECLRAIAGAFELEVYELMYWAPRMNAQASPQPPGRTNSSPLSRCICYLPVMKMTLGSLSLVLLTAFAIRLSPFLLDYLDSETRTAESYSASAENGIVRSNGARPSSKVSLPAPLLSQGENLSAQGSSRRVPAATEKDFHPAIGVTETENNVKPQAVDERHPATRIDFDRHVSASSLVTVARGQLDLPPFEPTVPADRLVAKPREGEGFADLVGHGVVDQSLLVGRSFVWSGKSTVTLLTKAGGSIKRAFY